MDTIPSPGEVSATVVHEMLVDYWNANSGEDVKAMESQQATDLTLQQRLELALHCPYFSRIHRDFFRADDEEVCVCVSLLFLFSPQGDPPPPTPCIVDFVCVCVCVCFPRAGLARRPRSLVASFGPSLERVPHAAVISTPCLLIFFL